eukprot:m.357273 g.357273  ORF g.357273 m.357273 type:complete len:344 (+) comp28026_c1_seq2:2853-3884(+)
MESREWNMGSGEIPDHTDQPARYLCVGIDIGVMIPTDHRCLQQCNGGGRSEKLGLLLDPLLLPFGKLGECLAVHPEMLLEVFVGKVHFELGAVDLFRDVAGLQLRVRVLCAPDRELGGRRLEVHHVHPHCLGLHLVVRFATTPLVIVPRVEVAGEVWWFVPLVDHHERHVVDLSPRLSLALFDVRLCEVHRLFLLLEVGARPDPHENVAVCIEQHHVLFDQILLVKVEALFGVKVPLVVRALEEAGHNLRVCHSRKVRVLPFATKRRPKALGLFPLHQHFGLAADFDVPDLPKDALGEVALFTGAAVAKPQVQFALVLQDEAVARIERWRSSCNLDCPNVKLV